MLFIVKGKVYKRGYMSERDEVEEVMHPVEAADEQEACDIFESHYSSKTQEYAVYYSASATEVYETLKRAG